MKTKETDYRRYKLVKIARNNKFYWRPMYKNHYEATSNKVCDWLGVVDNDWQWLGILIKDTDILAPAEYGNKFAAMRRIVQDIQLIRYNGKFEVFEEIVLDKKVELNK